MASKTSDKLTELKQSGNHILVIPRLNWAATGVIIALLTAIFSLGSFVVRDRLSISAKNTTNTQIIAINSTQITQINDKLNKLESIQETQRVSKDEFNNAISMLTTSINSLRLDVRDLREQEASQHNYHLKQSSYTLPKSSTELRPSVPVPSHDRSPEESRQRTIELLAVMPDNRLKAKR